MMMSIPSTGLDIENYNCTQLYNIEFCVVYRLVGNVNYFNDSVKNNLQIFEPIGSECLPLFSLIGQPVNHSYIKCEKHNIFETNALHIHQTIILHR